MLKQYLNLLPRHSTLSGVSVSLLSAMFLAFVSTASAQVSFDNVNDVYNADFGVPVNSSQPRPWVDNSTIPGWWGRVDNAAATVYSVSAGTNGTGGLMAYSPTAIDANPASAFGLLTTSGQQNLLAVELVNNTGSELTEVTVSFGQLQWYGGNGAASDVFAASYRLGGTLPVGGSFTNVADLDMDGFSSGGGGLAEPVSKNVIGTISNISWNDGESLWIRWIDSDVSGGDAAAGFSSMSITVVPEPATTGALIASAALLLTVLTRRKR